MFYHHPPSPPPPASPVAREIETNSSSFTASCAFYFPDLVCASQWQPVDLRKDPALSLGYQSYNGGGGGGGIKRSGGATDIERIALLEIGAKGIKQGRS
ncbi:unnamed protein product [Jaminaea pallidilutea]